MTPTSSPVTPPSPASPPPDARPPELSGAADWCRPPSPRVVRLRHAALTFADEKDPIERALLVTESYQRTEALPAALRRARAHAHILAHETVRIWPDELLVGTTLRRVQVHPGVEMEHAALRALGYPDLQRLPACRAGDHGKGAAAGSGALAGVLAYWRDRNVSAAQKLQALLPDEIKRARRAGVFAAAGFLAHNIPNYPMALTEGLEAIAARAEARLTALDPTDAAQVQQRPFVEAMARTCRAGADYGRRYAAVARDLAAVEPDPIRRRELHEIAAVCERVPALPARTFREAIQSVLLVHVINLAGDGVTASSLGRLDQYLYPFYARDLATGRLSEPEALELIECLWLKLFRATDFQHVTLGGVRPDGRDGTNALSMVCLEATAALGLHRDLAVRVHPGTPQAFLDRALAVVKRGLGAPDLWNDAVLVPALVEHGIAPEHARDYAMMGAVEVGIPGRANTRTMGHAVNLAKCLELALNDGRCSLTGEHLGLPTGNPLTFTTFEELRAAYRAQVAHAVRQAIAVNVQAQLLQPSERPMPFLSALTEDCIGRGRDVTDGGARYNPAAVNLFGIASAADSLAALRTLVYEERRVPLADLLAALHRDFAGAAPLRRLLLTRGPKYGNGDPRADDIAREEAAYYCDEVARYRTVEGERFLPLLFGLTTNALYGFGPRTGATPDGRKAGAPLPVSLIPGPGGGTRGVTALLRSAAQVDARRFAGGVSFTLDVDPAVAGACEAGSGESGTARLRALVQGYFALGGAELGLSIVDETLLRAARRDPEAYQHLCVRVFGFSARFVGLAPEVQRYIIARCRHERR